MRSERAVKDALSIPWVAFAEVFLVLSMTVAAAAGVINSDLSKARDENVLLDDENEKLTTKERELEDRVSELEDSNSQLENDLADAKDALDNISGVSAMLARVRKELEDARKDLKNNELLLAQAQTELTNTKNKLQSAQTELTSAQTDLANAQTELESAQTELENKEKELADTMTQLKASQVRVAALLGEKNTLAIDLKDAEEKQKELDEKLAKLADLLKESKDENFDLVAAINELRLGQGRVSQEILGLKGSRRRVVFLYDRSGSMDSRWDHTRTIVDAWLKHLHVEEFAIVAFNDNVEVFPARGQMMTMGGADGQANRKRLMTWLKDTIKPVGFTNTLAAFKAAYEYHDPSTNKKLDMIVLFTDGEPRLATTAGKFDVRMADEIRTLCRRHSSIPINAVGLGKFYKQEQLGDFLMEIAGATDGSFMGR